MKLNEQMALLVYRVHECLDVFVFIDSHFKYKSSFKQRHPMLNKMYSQKHEIVLSRVVKICAEDFK